MSASGLEFSAILKGYMQQEDEEISQKHFW